MDNTKGYDFKPFELDEAVLFEQYVSLALTTISVHSIGSDTRTQDHASSIFYSLRFEGHKRKEWLNPRYSTLNRLRGASKGLIKDISKVASLASNFLNWSSTTSFSEEDFIEKQLGEELLFEIREEALKEYNEYLKDARSKYKASGPESITGFLKYTESNRLTIMGALNLIYNGDMVDLFSERGEDYLYPICSDNDGHPVGIEDRTFMFPFFNIESLLPYSADMGYDISDAIEEELMLHKLMDKVPWDSKVRFTPTTFIEYIDNLIKVNQVPEEEIDDLVFKMSRIYEKLRSARINNWKGDIYSLVQDIKEYDSGQNNKKHQALTPYILKYQVEFLVENIKNDTRFKSLKYLLGGLEKYYKDIKERFKDESNLLKMMVFSSRDVQTGIHIPTYTGIHFNKYFDDMEVLDLDLTLGRSFEQDFYFHERPGRKYLGFHLTIDNYDGGIVGTIPLKRGDEDDATRKYRSEVLSNKFVKIINFIEKVFSHLEPIKSKTMRNKALEGLFGLMNGELYYMRLIYGAEINDGTFTQLSTSQLNYSASNGDPTAIAVGGNEMVDNQVVISEVSKYMDLEKEAFSYFEGWNDLSSKFKTGLLKNTMKTIG